MKCPECGGSGHEVAEEVDIGVGVQKHLIGFDCDTCGGLTVCERCGEWDFKEPPHFEWCHSVDMDMDDGLPF